ncbi:MAG: hypothetical protein ACKPKO_24015, partial [Candidatus Fonsibacter sp.]
MFYDANKQLITTTHFGATGYPDYTVPPHDEEKRKRYISRHKSIYIYLDNAPALIGSFQDSLDL